MMYKEVVQLVLLYGSETWVATGDIIKVLEGLHHQAARRITGIKATCGASGDWEYQPVVAALEAAVLHPIMEYIRRRQANIEEKV